MRSLLLVSTVFVSLLLVPGPPNAQVVDLAEEVGPWRGVPRTGVPSTWSVCSGDCDFTTIQAAVDYAQLGDTVELGAETFFENVTVDKELIIRGAGAGHTVVDGNAGAHVFLHTANYLTLSDMTVRNADVGIESYGEGMIVENCVVRDNTAGVRVIAWEPYVAPEVVILTTTITGTQPPSSQPCVSNVGADLTIVRSTISGCQTGVYTTGWYGSDCLAPSSCEDWYMVGMTKITTSTVTGNERGVLSECVRAGFCTDVPCCNLCRGAAVSVENSTIADSTEFGLSVESNCGCGQGCIAALGVKGSIVDNSGVSDCSGASDGGFNISNDGTCPWTHQADSLLLPLADNGGPTWTHPLAPDSPAIDAGSPSCGPTDQRGVARPHDGDGDGVAECDIGAFEYTPPVDADQDGVLDPGDFCAGTTIPESVPTHHLGVNRWALVDGDGTFDTTPPPGGGGGPDFEFTVDETRGCSCEQIIEALALGSGHTKFGCSTGAMLQWKATVWDYQQAVPESAAPDRSEGLTTLDADTGDSSAPGTHGASDSETRGRSDSGRRSRRDSPRD